MPAIKVKNQAELDKALKTITADDWIVCVGNGRFEFSGYNGLIRTQGTDSPRMEAWESSSPRMEAWGGKSTGRVGKYAAMTIADHGGKFNIPGAHILPTAPTIENIEEWIDYWGVGVKRGIATLYKALTAGEIEEAATASTNAKGDGR